MSKIAFDYDGTISEDFEGWREVMSFMKDRGHEVFVVTFRDERYDSNDDLQFLYEDGYDIYWTRGVAKKWWCEQFGPGKVDVWIDDKPQAILNNSELSVDGLYEWRESSREEVA